MGHYECKGCGYRYDNCECKKAKIPPKPIAPQVLKSTQNFGQLSHTQVPSTNLGWKCPGCGSCYAPHIQKCYTCGVPTYATS